MTTRYINLDASQAIEINENNNRYTVQLNETLELPTGTNIQVQNSLINLQGITGQSIELEKDFFEEILFNYYLVDTSYSAPIAGVTDPSKITNYNLYADMRNSFNGEFGFLPQPNGLIQRNESEFLNGKFGFTENVLPLVGVRQLTIGGTTENKLVPLVGRAPINIKKGIYSVESLAQLITDQINRVVASGDELDFNPDQSNYDFVRTSGAYNGLSVNYTTTRMIQTPTKDQIENFKQPGGGLWSKDLPGVRALGLDDNDEYGVYGIKPTHFDEVIKQAKTATYKPSTDYPDLASELKCFQEPLVPGTDNPQFGITLQRTNAGNGEVDANGFKNYCLFNNGTMIGTTGFSMDYDSKASGFSFSHLHEPRRIPTNDRFGNSLQNPSQECVFTKRIYNPLELKTAIPYDYYEGTTDNEKELIYGTLNAIMGRTSGIQVFNWAYSTAKKNATADITNLYGVPGSGDNPDSNDNNDFKNYNDFFTTRKEAETAWRDTLWFRLGFTYDQLQNNDNYEVNYWFGDNETLQGITTQPDVDGSLIPFVSTLYNDFGLAAESTTEGDQAKILPAVGVLQLFDLNDCNVPLIPFNNNKAGPKYPDGTTAQEVCVSPYMGSFYTYAVCIPVQVAGLDITAKELPRLSINGYMLILSDLVNQNDQAGNRSECGILDLIPKSSLSNQDFIATINEIVHTLSNPKVVNSIEINILNGDLTDLSLEPNSTVLVKITTPTPRPTELLANVQENIAENQVQQTVEQTQQLNQEAQTPQPKVEKK